MGRRVFHLTITAALIGSCASGAAAPALEPPPPRPVGVRLTPVIVDATGRITAKPAPIAPGAEPAALAVSAGEATYYANKFDGRRAASGIVFRNSEAYAAHRTYPFGTLVRVTSLVNDRSVIVRIIDRGPHGTSERARRTIIDLSQSAARELDFMKAGRIPVRVEVLEWGPGGK